MIKKKILIIGGTGFIGYHLMKFLKKKKFFITSFSTNKPRKIRLLRKVNYIEGNIAEINDLKVLKNENFNYIVNLGGYVDHSNKKLTYKSHYLGCVNLVKIFKSKDINSFIQIGSSLEYGNLKSPQKEHKERKVKSIYAKSKLLATKYLLKNYRLNKFPAIILRGYQVYGPRQDPNRLISTVIINCIKNNSFPCSSGNQTRDFLHVDDFVEAIYKSLDNKKAKGKIFNIGYGEPKKVKDIINIIKKIINKGKPKFNVLKLRKDETMSLYPSISSAKKIIKWKPRIRLLDGIKQTIRDYKKNI